MEMEDEETGDYFQIDLGNGKAMYFEVRRNETMRDFKQRLQESGGISVDFSQADFDDETDVLSYFSAVASGGGEGAEERIEETNLKEEEIGGGEQQQGKGGKVEGLAGMFCSVPGCDSNKLDNPDLALFRFPAKKKRCMMWVEAIQRHDLDKETVGFLSTQLAVCANHFPAEEFASKDRKLLRQTAVPSLLLSPVKEELLDQDPKSDILDEDMMSLSYSEPPEHAEQPEMLEEGGDNQEEEEEHPGSLCRLCASPIPSNPLFLFEDGGDSSLAEKINASLPITVSKWDVLPKQVCQVCWQRVELQHSFAQACANAEKKLVALTRRFLVNGLKKPTCGKRGRSKQTHCCPLCCRGGMRYVTNDSQPQDKSSSATPEQQQDASSAITQQDGSKDPQDALSVGDVHDADDTMTGLYSDDAESDGDVTDVILGNENSGAFLNLVYLPDDRNFSYECGICEEVFASASETLLHTKAHADANAAYHPCIVCGLVLPSDDLLTNHFSHHRIKLGLTRRGSPWKTTLRCETCGLQANTRKTFILHKCSNPVLDVRTTGATGEDLGCPDCERTFTTARRAVEHRLEHEQGDPGEFSCLECDMQTGSQRILEHHVTSVHEEVEHRCTECGLRFMTQQQLTRHSKVHDNLQYQFQCSLCNETFASLQAVNQHVQTHNTEDEVTEAMQEECAKCGQQFGQRAHLQHHMETAHDAMGRMPSLIQYQCNVCSERIKTSAEVLVHRTLHWKSPDPMLPYVCEYCGEAHPSPNSLARHRRYLHPDEHPYVCTLCDTSTRTLYEARVHRKTHTGYVAAPLKPQPKIYQCEHCPSLFSEKASFLSHKKSHKLTKWFQCDMCEKAFPERHRLIVHKRQHTGEKPYACGTCGKRFAQTSAMYTHALLHTGETPHSCDICHRKFRIKSDRDSHRRTHTGEKPYKCQFCDKRFRTGQVFYQHRMIHTGERRFPCDVCGRAFKRSHTMVCHRRIHTGEKPNVCDICGKAFRQRTDMRKHKMNLHNVAA